MCNRFLKFARITCMKIGGVLVGMASLWAGPGEGNTRNTGGPQCEAPSGPATAAGKKDLAKKGFEAARQAVAANPEDSKARLALAVACGRLARLESPRRQMELSRLIKTEAEEAVRLDPQNDMAWHVLARWNFEMSSVNALARGLAQAIFGKFPEASAARAEECFQKALSTGPPRVMHHVEYGLMLEKLNRKIDARKQLETGLSLPPKDQEDEETQQRARQALDRLR